ncbi:hypothetical protein GBAR_LOCUS20691 [Geodia barretti]|uniref:Uncharacterized protein n=1 Tax=Geodia barretti TaxID=519541 RepID=A0AA35SWG5_GEOBA|nr:hypothetical protein GBAR_LOCUS20691 [Geodia barretti]
MALPTPPTAEDIEEDLASALHTDPAFSLPGEASGDCVGDEVTAVAEQAVQFVLAYDSLKEDSGRSLPATLAALEQNMAELRTVIRAPSK